MSPNKILPLNVPFDVQIHLIDLVDYEYMSNEQVTGSSLGDVKIENFLHSEL